MGSNNSTGSFDKGSESSMSRTSKAASTRSISIKGGRSGIPWSVKLVKVGSDSEHQGLSQRITSRVRRFPVCLLHKLGKRNFSKGHADFKECSRRDGCGNKTDLSNQKRSRWRIREAFIVRICFTNETLG